MTRNATGTEPGKDSPADELAANLPLAVILPRVKGTRQLKVEHMTHDLAAHILHVSLLLCVEVPALKRRCTRKQNVTQRINKMISLTGGTRPMEHVLLQTEHALQETCQHRHP